MRGHFIVPADAPLRAFLISARALGGLLAIELRQSSYIRGPRGYPFLFSNDCCRRRPLSALGMAVGGKPGGGHKNTPAPARVETTRHLCRVSNFPTPATCMGNRHPSGDPHPPAHLLMPPHPRPHPASTPPPQPSCRCKQVQGSQAPRSTARRPTLRHRHPTAQTPPPHGGTGEPGACPAAARRGAGRQEPQPPRRRRDLAPTMESGEGVGLPGATGVGSSGGRGQTDAGRVDLSIFWAGPGSGRAEKNFCYCGPKKSCPCPSHWTHRASISGPGSGRARAWAGRPRIL
jgi:hypothetical protein